MPPSYCSDDEDCEIHSVASVTDVSVSYPGLAQVDSEYWDSDGNGQYSDELSGASLAQIGYGSSRDDEHSDELSGASLAQIAQDSSDGYYEHSDDALSGASLAQIAQDGRSEGYDDDSVDTARGSLAQIEAEGSDDYTAGYFAQISRGKGNKQARGSQPTQGAGGNGLAQIDESSNSTMGWGKGGKGDGLAQVDEVSSSTMNWGKGGGLA